MKRKRIIQSVSILLIAILCSTAITIPVISSSANKKQGGAIQKDIQSVSLKSIRIKDVFPKIEDNQVSMLKDSYKKEISESLYYLVGMFILLTWLKLLKKDHAPFSTILVVDFITARWQYHGRELGYLPSDIFELEKPILAELVFSIVTLFLGFQIFNSYYNNQNSRIAIIWDILFELWIGIYSLFDLPGITNNLSN